MKQAQDKILEIVKDRNDSNFLYTEARRKLSQLRRGEVGKEVAEEIRQLINRAQEQRPDWHEPYVISAELELQAGNFAQALRQYDEAAKRGRLYPRALAQHIELLYRFGRFAEAGRQMERLSEPLRQTLLGPLYPEILFLTDQRDTALKEARAATEREPENPQNYYWYSQLLSRSARVAGLSEEQRKKAEGDQRSDHRHAPRCGDTARVYGRLVRVDYLLFDAPGRGSGAKNVARGPTGPQRRQSAAVPGQELRGALALVRRGNDVSGRVRSQAR
jgi:tetratricopeptide (TPR) repeat protein